MSATDWIATTCQFAAAISEPLFSAVRAFPGCVMGGSALRASLRWRGPPAHYNTEAPLSPAPRLTYPDSSTCGSTSGSARSS